MALVKAKLVNISADPPVEVPVLFNPTDYSVDRGATYAEVAVPGLRTPIMQFIRGEASSLQLELFLDRTNERKNLEEDLQRLRKFVQIDGELHAPPVCRFEWGGQLLNGAVSFFQGVVTSFKEKYSLFSEDGKVTRARIGITIKSYESAEVQLRELRRSSPDRTRVRVIREGETLALLAYQAYGDPRLWRLI
ncbi:MAG: peptidoglycan-binding protein, partial [Acidobacteriota bacterium]